MHMYIYVHICTYIVHTCTYMYTTIIECIHTGHSRKYMYVCTCTCTDIIVKHI